MYKISIVIPTINRYECLKNTLQDIHNQSIKEIEIIIVDQTDKKVVKKITGKNIVYIWQEEKSASKARNKGLFEAKSDIVLFLDDDIIIDNKDFLKNHLHHYKKKETSGVVGSILSTDKKFTSTLPNKVNKKFIGWIYFPYNYDKSYKTPNGKSGNLSVNKNYALDVGGMDERYQKGAYREESDFCFRLTKKYGNLIYDPNCYLIHIGNPIGGTRSWVNSKGKVHGYQHMFGSWYFMFKNLPISIWGEYTLLMVKRFILHKKLFYSFYLLPFAIIKYKFSFFHALYSSFKKPLTINKYKSESFN